MTVSQPMPPGTGQPVDTRPMIVVHTALRREFRLTADAIRAAGAGDRDRAVVLAAHLLFLLDLLHHHHSGEDAFLWPKLTSRAPVDTAPLIELMQAQHDGLDALLAQSRAAAGDWQADPGRAQRDRLAGLLDGLNAGLAEHLAAEERDILPLAAVYLSEPEWREIGQAAVDALPRPKLPLVFGMFALEGEPEVLRVMLQEAPPLPRRLMPRLGPRAYAKYARRVYGSASPVAARP